MLKYLPMITACYNFEKIKNKYARQAFENKKWAFVSDYIRLYALYNHGGIYLDTDVEITQNIDRFLVHDFVSGFEKWKDIYSPVTAFMGAKQEHKISQQRRKQPRQSIFTATFHRARDKNALRESPYRK